MPIEPSAVDHDATNCAGIPDVGPAAKVNAPINVAHAAATKTLGFILRSTSFGFTLNEQFQA